MKARFYILLPQFLATSPQTASSVRSFYKIICKNSNLRFVVRTAFIHLSCTLAFLIFLPTLNADVTKWSVSTTSPTPYFNAEGDGYHVQLAKEIFKRAGIEIQMQFLPAKRALKNLSAGLDDAMYVRAKAFELKDNELIRVPVSPHQAEFAAFTADPTLNIQDWQDLRDLKVAYVRGWRVFDGRTTNSVKVDDPVALFRQLKIGRVQAVLFEKVAGLYQAQLMGFPSIQAFTLARQDMYVYLNKKHARYLDPLAAAIQSVNQDGTRSNFYAELMQQLSGKTLVSASDID